MIRCLFSLLAAMVPTALAMISKGDLSDATLMQNDAYVYYMNKVFDVSKVKGIPTFTTNNGTLRTAMTPITERAIEGGFAKVEVIEYIDNSTFGVVFDNSHAVVQYVDIEGNRFTKNIDFSYFRFGVYTRCDDLEVYKPTSKIYIACWDTEQVGEEEPGPVFLIEVDMKNTDNFNVIDVNQTDGFSIQHRIRMGIWTLPQGGAEDTYLVLYDQGMSSTQVTKNKWMRVFDRIRVGKAAYVGVVDIGRDFPNARSLYDIFYFNQQLLLTTSIIGESFISMTSCDFLLSNLTVACNETSRKVSNVSFGYVGMTINQRWVQFDLNSNQFVTCDVRTNFSRPDWRVQNCEVFMDIPKFEDCFIRIVEDNWHAKVVIWVYPNGEYAGISVHSRELNRSWKEENVTAVLINKYLYQAEVDKIIIRRLEYDSVLIKAQDFSLPETVLTFTAEDDESSGIVMSSIVYTMQDARERIGFRDDHYLPEVNLYGGNTFYMPLTEDDILGNNLKFDTTFTDPIVNYTNTQIYNTFRVNIIYTFKKTGLPEFSEITFTPNFAVGKDLQNRIFFFKCGSTELDQVRCDEQLSFTVNSKTQLQKYSRELLTYVLVWTKDSVKTTVYLWDPNSGELFSNEYPGSASDVHSIVVKGRGWIFVAYTSTNEVKVSSWSPVNPSSFNDENSLNTANSNMPYFCPTDVYDTFDGTTGFLEILSVCNNAVEPDQRIFRYDPYTLAMYGSHPITLDLKNPLICTAGDAYIIVSLENGLVYGKSQTYDETHAEFYLDTYAQYDRLLGMNCVPSTNMLTIYFKDKFNKLGFFSIWGDTLKKANKRVHSTITDMSTQSDYIQSFSINGNLLHTLYDNEGSLNYWVSMAKTPMVRINTNAVSETANSTSGRMTLSMKNGGSSGGSTQATLTIRRMNTTITYNTSANTGVIGQNFSLEDYITLKGHIFNASLRDTRSGKAKDSDVKLIQRASKISSFVPPETEQVIYQHVEAHGNYTIALHMDRSYASFFTIFTNVSVHRGVIQPRDGVQSFDFGTLSNDRALIAYSSAPVSGHKLKFILINGADKISEASVEGREYSKIRLLPIDDKDNLVLFALEASSFTIDVFLCSVTSMVTQITHIRTMAGAVDFDITNPGTLITLYYLTDEGTDLKYISWKKTDLAGKQAASGDLQIQDEHKYWFMSVDCTADSDTYSTCVINTLGTIIFEAIHKNGGDLIEKVYYNNKFGNYDGKYIYVDSDFITMRAVTGVAPREYAFLVWKRQSVGGDGLLYYGINIDGAARPGYDIASGFTPYAMIKTPSDDHILFAGTHNELEPLQFYKVDKFRINSNLSKSDLGNIYLDVQGYAGANTEVGSISQFATDDKKSLKWWVPTLIVLVLLIGAAVTYFICVHNSKKDSGDAEGDYQRGEEDGGQQLLPQKENKSDA